MPKSMMSQHPFLVLAEDETMFIHYDCDGSMWHRDGNREVGKSINFATPFSQAPVLHVGFSLLDFAQDRAVRAEVVAEKITATGFELVFKIWGDTRAAQARANWIAFGPAGKSETYWQLEEDFD